MDLKPGDRIQLAAEGTKAIVLEVWFVDSIQDAWKRQTDSRTLLAAAEHRWQSLQVGNGQKQKNRRYCSSLNLNFALTIRPGPAIARQGCKRRESAS